MFVPVKMDVNVRCMFMSVARCVCSLNFRNEYHYLLFFFNSTSVFLLIISEEVSSVILKLVVRNMEL